MKFKNGNFTSIKIHFLKNRDIENILISDKTFSGQKNYKYFINYIDDDYKIKS